MNSDKEQLKQNLEKLAENNGPQQAVSYQDIFNPQFMQKNTSFTTIDVFVREAGVKEFPALDAMPQDKLNAFVKKETKFNSWEEMQQRAVNEYMTSLF